MDFPTGEIMHEVDELLGKLDKLPVDLQAQVLRRLSQKVSNIQGNGAISRKGRGRGRGQTSAKAASSSGQDDGNTKIKVTIKAEPQEEADSQIITSQKGHPIENHSLKCEEEVLEPERMIVSGRRHTKKVDYKQLSEYGLDENEDENKNGNDELENLISGKRRRRRAKKNSRMDTLDVSELGAKDSDTISISTENTEIFQEDGLESGKSDNDGGSFDLLESCLKESGIKSTGEKSYEGEKCNYKESMKLLKKHEEKEDKKVIICDSIDAINDVSRKKKVVSKLKGTSKFKCQECGKMYSSLSVLKTHQIRHLKKEDLPFPCKHCDFRSATKLDLFRHSFKHDKSLTYSCNICSKQFSRDTGLREHMKFVHAKLQMLKCGICQFSTPRRSTMRNHLSTHEGTTPVIACPVCESTFRSKTNLRIHLLSHAGLKKFECDICGKKFINGNRVKAHKLHVHGPKDHSCPFCEMKFPTQHALNRHILVHTGEKPFQCCFCSFMCNTQGNLIKHIRQVHEKINFTYKDFLRESKRDSEQQSSEQQRIDSKNMEKMQKEGQEFANKVFHSVGESMGETFTLEQLKEEVQKKKDSKVAAFQEQLSKRKRKVLKRPLINNNTKDKKITIYSFAEKSGEAIVDPPVDENVYTETGLSNLTDDNSCWLTHTDEDGCVMLIPWDVSLINENDEEEGEWRQDLPVDKIVKVTNPSSVQAVVSKSEDISMSNIDDDCNVSSLESALEISREEGVKVQVEERGNVLKVRDLCEVVDSMDRLDVDISVDTSRSENVTTDKKGFKQLPKTVQVIGNNAPVNNSSAAVSNIVLPEGYLVDDEGQVLQITGNVMGTNLLQLQMGQVISATDPQPDAPINKLTNSIYSMASRGESSKAETFLIASADKNEERREKRYNRIKPKKYNPNVNLLTMENEEAGDHHSALVLIVDADDVDKQ